MASNKSFNSNNIQVKIEPDTSASSMPSTSSMSTSSTSLTPLSERVSSIKMEPGLPTTTQRLTSFRLPRDLTLGGNIKTEKPKKVYMPNLNVQRNKKKDDPATKNEPVKSRHSDRGRERGRGDRGRGRGDRGNIIQSVGVWSEGIYSAPSVSRRSEGTSKSSNTANAAKYLEKPKFDMKKTTDKTEKEKKLEHLLTFDFIDDGPDIENKIKPLILPRIKKDIYEKIDYKIDRKPVISENGEIIDVEKGKKGLQDQKEELTICQIIENKTNSYTLIQFPESLPGVESSREEPGSKQPNTSNDSNTSSESDDKTKTERCILNNLKSGPIGKLEIFKSGKARLRFGEISFFVDIGSQQRFQQDLLAVKIDSESSSGDLVNLGPINNKLICSPDFESMLNDS
ncbi:hypothetical protein P5V15_008062 [Pogonomyrmex californicus]